MHNYGKKCPPTITENVKQMASWIVNKCGITSSGDGKNPVLVGTKLRHPWFCSTVR